MSFDLDNLRQKVAQHGPVMRLIVLETKGSAPRPAGTEMLVWDDGQDGTIGGGTFEYQAIDTREPCFKAHPAQIIKLLRSFPEE